MIAAWSGSTALQTLQRCSSGLLSIRKVHTLQLECSELCALAMHHRVGTSCRTTMLLSMQLVQRACECHIASAIYALTAATRYASQASVRPQCPRGAKLTSSSSAFSTAGKRPHILLAGASTFNCTSSLESNACKPGTQTLLAVQQVTAKGPRSAAVLCP